MQSKLNQLEKKSANTSSKTVTNKELNTVSSDDNKDIHHSFLFITYTFSAPFSLRNSDTTSKMGKTHLIPTPHCIKSALISHYANSHDDEDLLRFFKSIHSLRMAFEAPKDLIVTQGLYTQLKSVKDKKKSKKDFEETVMYKEYVHYNSDLHIFINISNISQNVCDEIIQTMMNISYLGKKDSLVVYRSHSYVNELPSDSIHIYNEGEDNIFGMIVVMDDLYQHVPNKKMASYLSDLKELGGFGKSRLREKIPYYFPYKIVSSAKKYTHYRLLE